MSEAVVYRPDWERVAALREQEADGSLSNLGWYMLRNVRRVAEDVGVRPKDLIKAVKTAWGAKLYREAVHVDMEGWDEFAGDDLEDEAPWGVKDTAEAVLTCVTSYDDPWWVAPEVRIVEDLPDLRSAAPGDLIVVEGRRFLVMAAGRLLEVQ